MSARFAAMHRFVCLCRHWFPLIAILSMATVSLSARATWADGGVTVTVRDSHNGELVRNAMVVLEETSGRELRRTLLSDFYGEAKISPLSAGVYHLTVTAVGYHKSTIIALPVNDGIVRIDIALTFEGSIGPFVYSKERDTVVNAAPRTIYDLMKADTAHFGTLASDIDSSHMEAAYRDNGPYTVFAPDNIAFAKLTPNDIHALSGDANRAPVQALLLCHTVNGRYSMGDLRSLPDGTRLVTLAGTLVIVHTDRGTLTINGVLISSKFGLMATNGYIYMIDTVLALPASR